MNFPPALDPFRSIQTVYRAAKASPGPLLAWWFGGLGAFFLVYLVVYVPAVVMMAASGAANQGVPPAWVFVILAGAILLLVVFMFVGQCLWIIGLETLLFDVLRTGRCSAARAWSQRHRFGAMFGATLIVFGFSLLVYVPFVLGALGFAALAAEGEPPLLLVVAAVVLGGVWMLVVFYVFLGFTFVNPAAALDECGAVEAVRRSWNAARGHRLAIVWLLFVTVLAALSGLLLLCVGYLFTTAFATLVPGEAYLALTRGEEMKRWWITTGVVGDPDAERAPAADPNAY